MTSTLVDTLETFEQQTDDPQVARAAELERLGDHRRAERVLRCGTPDGLHTRRRCRLRMCPACSKRLAAANGRIARAIVAKMARPVVTLFALPSTGAKDLADTIARFRRAFAKIRRQRILAGVRAAVGALEMPLTATGAWNVHAHLVVDADALDEVRIAAAWRRLTDGRGTFSVDGPPRDRAEIAVYLAKSATWCPPPGSLTLGSLDVLRWAAHGRQLLIRWGGRRGGRRLPARSAP